MIEFTRDSQQRSGDTLVLNGQRVVSDRVHVHRSVQKGVERFSVAVDDHDVASIIAEHGLSELPASVLDLRLSFNVGWIDHPIDVSISPPDELDPVHIFTASPNLRLKEWRRLWSYDQYLAAVEGVVSQQPFTSFRWKWYNDDGESQNPFGVEWEVPGCDRIWNEIARALLFLREVHVAAELKLHTELRPDTLLVHFSFPPGVRGPCEHYLSYFVEFLREIGIESTSEVRHSASDVLFSVLPNDPAIALDRIRQALAVYLQFPDSPVIDGAMKSSDVRVIQLAAVVQHYRSQLLLAQAALQMKDAAIDMQRRTLEDQNALLGSSAVLIQSLKGVANAGETLDREEFLDGIIQLGQWEEKGITLDWAKGIRAIRRWLSGGTSGS